MVIIKGDFNDLYSVHNSFEIRVYHSWRFIISQMCCGRNSTDGAGELIRQGDGLVLLLVYVCLHLFIELC